MWEFSSSAANKANLLPDFFLDTIPDYAQSATPSNASQASSSSELSNKVNGLMDIIKNNLSSELVQNTQAVYHFTTSGWFYLILFLQISKFSIGMTWLLFQQMVNIRGSLI